MHAIRVSRTGDPSVLEYVSVDRPRPGKGEALVRLEAIGHRESAQVRSWLASLELET